MTVIEDRLPTIEELILRKGAHSEDSGEMCVMEAVAFVAGEPWSDHPACASNIIGAFMRSWNDLLDDEGRQKLKPYVTKLVGSKAPKTVENKRAWLATDWLIHHQAPAWLDLAGCTEQAAALRALPPILSTAKAKKAQPVLNDARAKASAAGAAARAAAWDAARDAAGAAAGAAAWAAAGDAAGAAARAAAWAAAWDAAWAAAGDAARDAARAAAGAAARDAARDAARAAAGAAARAAAGAAAWEKLAPTVTSLQASAFDLLDEMLAVHA